MKTLLYFLDMPHTRPRHLESLVIKTLRFSPITGIFGHRQVGKTTLASSLSSKYVSLDLVEELSHSTANPTGFLAKHQSNPLTIDECQLSPPLFPAMKEWVRLHKSPGQFLLTGSVRFSSRKAIRESLTGRIVAWDLLPMDWAEQYEQSLSDVIPKLLRSKSLKVDLKSNPTFKESCYKRYLQVGGFPGIFGIRDPAIRAQRFETQLNTILERDLKLLIQTQLDYKTLRRFLQVLASLSGKPFEISELSKLSRISLPTLRRLVAAAESLFLIRFIPSEGAYSKPVLFFEDVGEKNHLLQAPNDETNFLSFLYQNLRTQIHYRPELKIELFSYRAKSGECVPLCFRSDDRVLGIIPTLQTESLASSHKDALHFIKKYPGAKVLLIGLKSCDQLLSESIRHLGVEYVL